MKNILRILAVTLLISACGQIESPPMPTPSARPARPTPTATAAPLPTKAVRNINRTSHGYILADEIWKGEVHITGDIIVDRGITLTIMPGTTVYVAANQDIENLRNDPFDLKTGIKQEDNFDGGVHLGEPYRDEAHHISITVLGKLVAVGTSARRITFTSDSQTPASYDWNRLEVAEGNISYALIEYYRVLALGDEAVISRSELRHMGECGVCANSSGLVENNHIWDAGHELIDMHDSSPRIRNNLLGPYPQRFAIILDGGSPVITGNTFQDCGGGLLMISPSTPVFENNKWIRTPVEMRTAIP